MDLVVFSKCLNFEKLDIEILSYRDYEPNETQETNWHHIYGKGDPAV